MIAHLVMKASEELKAFLKGTTNQHYRDMREMLTTLESRQATQEKNKLSTEIVEGKSMPKKIAGPAPSYGTGGAFSMKDEPKNNAGLAPSCGTGGAFSMGKQAAGPALSCGIGGAFIGGKFYSAAAAAGVST